ncbi:MAG: bifunctional adenosylcobinamide kinase/adenosylcobinamide-phosphate guanylyltransferase [Calditerrivibrio sp.]|nr:bifunctional adenosylcobinamide kinase/adenosylcobinamide-phosphate guanylyltransferase [Calditerrivibrio sp.]MCA1932727.1 bifunctional adenosylcobinamide kinase/adenosylcobinamide-phosphate guanylyltransferase [Calditerrivibrio sp.]
MVTVITGGVKSGKSSYALSIGREFKKKLFIATAEPFDDEMKRKIKLHRSERGRDWELIEEPISLVNGIKKGEGYDYILVDCLTMWVNNLLHYNIDTDIAFSELIGYLKSYRGNVVFVTNEVGLGVVPVDPVSRRYMNLLGVLNQNIARLADNLIFLVSGYPIYLKSDNSSILEHP